MLCCRTFALAPDSGGGLTTGALALALGGGNKRSSAYALFCNHAVSRYRLGPQRRIDLFGFRISIRTSVGANFARCEQPALERRSSSSRLGAGRRAVSRFVARPV